MARRGLTLPSIQKASSKLAEQYRFDASGYILDKLGWTPWSGGDSEPGQLEIIEAYELALRQQFERKAFEDGELEYSDLKYWQPGDVIQNWIRVEAGHTVGKTKLSSGIVNHFFDCFPPAIIYTFAPTAVQIHDLLWKEIKSDRRGKGLPGRILDLRLEIDDNHFAVGRATSDNGGRGTERVQGQHGEFLLFVLDEAEGIPTFVYNAVESMTGGGISIVLMLANPRTRSSDFHKKKKLPHVKTFRLACTNHPNVVAGREVVPGAVKRQYVENMAAAHCEVVREHEDDNHTFELSYPIRIEDTLYPPGTIFKPNPEFMFRVLGIAPKNLADNTLVPVGRYEAACNRAPDAIAESLRESLKIRMGVDVSRYGKDYGTLYIQHQGFVWREEQFWKSDTAAYTGPIKAAALKLWDEAPAGQKPNSLHIRIDGTGGFGSGVIDGLKDDPELIDRFEDFKVFEVHFSETAFDEESYANKVTEMYAEAAESIKGIAILKAPEALEADLCERPYKWINREGIAVKTLMPKDDFKTKFKRSPDDGDGFVLCVGPDHIFPSYITDVW